MATGIRVVDVMFPIAQCQREPFIGDRQTGKTFIAIATVISQQLRNGSVGQRKNLLTLASCSGQRVASGVRMRSVLFNNDTEMFVSVLLATVTATMTSQFIGPLSATSILEIYRNSGAHCYIVYDDLSKHAIAYRQLCLYLRKPAGREAFPSDVFYLHSKIPENIYYNSKALVKKATTSKRLTSTD